MDPQDVGGSESDDEEEMLFTAGTIPVTPLGQNSDEESDEETLFSNDNTEDGNDDEEEETLFSTNDKEEEEKDGDDKNTLFSSKVEDEVGGSDSNDEETLFSTDGDGKDGDDNADNDEGETLFSVEDGKEKSEDGDEEETLFSTTGNSKEDEEEEEEETLFSTSEKEKEDDEGETLFSNETTKDDNDDDDTEGETLFSTTTNDDKDEESDENETLFSSSDLVKGDESETESKIDFELQSSPLPKVQKDVYTPLTPLGNEYIFSRPRVLTPDEVTRQKMKEAMKKKFEQFAKKEKVAESKAPETPLSPFVGDGTDYGEEEEDVTLFSTPLVKEDESSTTTTTTTTTTENLLTDDNKGDESTEDLLDDKSDEDESTEDLLATNEEKDESEDLLSFATGDDDDDEEEESEDLLFSTKEEDGESEDLLASTSASIDDKEQQSDEGTEDLHATNDEDNEREDLFVKVTTDDNEQDEGTEDLLASNDNESEDLFSKGSDDEDEGFTEDLLASSTTTTTDDNEEDESEDLLGGIQNTKEEGDEESEEKEENEIINQEIIKKDDETTTKKEKGGKEEEEEEEEEEGEGEEYYVDVESSSKQNEADVVHEEGSEEHIEQITSKLFLAIEDKDTDALNDLFECLPPSIFADDLISTTKPFRSGNWTPLHFACEIANNVEIVEFLIDKGSEIDACTASGCTPLHCAANQGNLEIFHKLIENGADPKKKNEKNWTTLHFAVIGGNFEMVKYLIEVVKLDVKEKTLGSAWTALHFSCRDGNLGMVKLLLSKGADIHARESGYENTPVHAAAFQGKFDVIKYLLWEKGPSILVKKNKQNWTVLHFIVRFRHYKIARYILVEGVQPLEKLEEVRNQKKLRVNTMYIQNLGVKRKTREERRKEAEERKRTEKFKKELGTAIHQSLNVQTDKGNTVLHFACRNLDFRMIQLLLLQKHIDRSIRNLVNKLPISYIPKIDDKNLPSKKKKEEEEEDGEDDGTVEFSSDLSSSSMIRQVHRLFSTNRKKMMMHVKNEMKHTEQQRQKIDNLYHHLFKKKLLTNAIIKTKEKYMVKCHQVVLSRSPFLRKYMTMQMSAEKPVVEIDALSYPRPVLMVIVEWMYGREPTVPPNIFSQVFKLAKEWELLYFQKHLVSLIVEYREDHVLDIAVLETDDDSPLFLQCLQYLKSHYIVYRMGRYQRIMKKNKKLFQKFKKLRTLKIPPALSHREFNHKNLPLLGTVHSQDLYTRHISEYCFSPKVREKWGSIILKTRDKKNFRFHKELLACSSVYFQDLFIKEGEKLPSTLSLEYHSFYLESLLKYVYHKPDLRVEECISMAMISKDFKLVSSENIFLEKIKTMTTKENLIDIVFKYGHLFFKEESVIKKEIVGIIKNYYDENVIAKLIDQLIGYKLQNTKLKREINESKNEVKSLTDQVFKITSEKQQQQQKHLKEEEEEEEGEGKSEADQEKLKEENEKLIDENKEMKDQIRKLKLKVKSFKDLFT